MTVETIRKIEVSPDIQELLNVWPLGLSFDLQPGDTVVVAGSYKGRVVDLLDQLYHPARIFGFDPQTWAMREAEARVGGRSNVYLLPFGIGLQDGTFPMGEWETDGCSFSNVGEGSRQQGEGYMREIRRAFVDLGIERVALFVMNMEGYEFDLLPYLIRTGATVEIDRLCVQFHHNFGNDGTYPEIREQLDRRYEVVVDDAPRWVYWRRKT